MSVKYERVEFEHAWQAAKAFEEGVKLYTMTPSGIALDIRNQLDAITFHGRGALFRKVKPRWWEKLDGTDENSVLVESDLYVFKAVNFIDGLVIADEGGTYASGCIKPVPSTKIEQWLKNAKEIEND
jgi:hypothetical protein